MTYVITPPAVPAVAIAGTDDLFPVNRVYCVGRNYAAHAIEMGHDPDREDPFFFKKAPDNLLAASALDGGGDFPYPPKTSDVHHEIELVAALGAGGRDIAVDAAMDCVWGFGVGIDMTRRDLQGEAKKAGRPWDTGKAFDHAAPIGRLHPIAETGPMEHGAIWVDVNGERRQEGDLNQLIWKVPEMISYLSGLFTLQPGDLIFTGTPSGVGPVIAGDVLSGGVDGVSGIEVRVV
ncbi:MAG: fumarylacetoacetate hydrolase family protein [Magnetovibrio sp.]|nr:fumarylacetoacetate hydrolase family protein [Magnetovibrio sp.]